MDTVSAGDSFVGGLAAATDRGYDLADALRYASVGGALACLQPGAQPSLALAGGDRRPAAGSAGGNVSLTNGPRPPPSPQRGEGLTAARWKLPRPAMARRAGGFGYRKLSGYSVFGAMRNRNDRGIPGRSRRIAFDDGAGERREAGAEMVLCLHAEQADLGEVDAVQREIGGIVGCLAAMR